MVTVSNDILTGPVPDDVAAWFADDYADLIAAYKSLTPEQAKDIRNPARDRACVRIGYLLAIANRRALPMPTPTVVRIEPPAFTPPEQSTDRACGICAAPMRMVTEHRKSGDIKHYAQCTQRRLHPKREVATA